VLAALVICADLDLFELDQVTFTDLTLAEESLVVALGLWSVVGIKFEDFFEDINQLHIE